MSPNNVIIAPPPPLSDFQRRALTLFIKKKRSGYEKKDAIISRKYKWLEDLNQRDPDLEGIEISESSLEELKKKRESLCEEKHRLFEQLKNLLPATEEDENQQQFPQYQQGGYLPQQPGYQPSFNVTPGYPGPVGSVPNFHPTPYAPPYSSTPYSVVTEPVTPKKPSEMSPMQGDRQIMKPSDMSPISSHERSGYNRSWDNISPVSKPPESDTHDQYNKFPSSEYSTPSAATKYAETRENRIDSFTKAFTDTISKAMMSELNMSLESATKTDSNPESHPSPLKPADPAPAPSLKPDSLLSPKHKPKDIPDIKKPEPAARPRSPGARPRSPSARPRSPGARPRSPTARPRSPTGRPRSPTARPRSPGARPRSPGARPRSPTARPRSPTARPRSPGARPRSPEAVRKPELKTSEVPKRGDGKVPEPRRVEHTAVNKGRKSISGTESNSSVASLKHPPQSPQLKQRKEEVSDLPPVIKISKAEIHSKVMSWPTSHPFARKTGERPPDVDKKPAGKKESADSSGSSLLEFAFQSALFGNTLFGDKEAASPTPGAAPPPQGPKTPPPTTSQAPSDLLTALSMSYGGGHPRKKEPQGEDKRDQEKSRKRDRSPDVRSPSPELVQVYKTEPQKPEDKKEEDKGKEGEKKTTPPPPPPPPPPMRRNTPPPPKSTTITAGSAKKVVVSPATPTMSYAPCSPGTSPAVVAPTNNNTPQSYAPCSPGTSPAVVAPSVPH
ncbi:nascent polypeptide-associated complex subunit alpha, muscle-specific form-like isoform X2 [Bolinopsis microptera]|uniref:nascent polypeptide-associated complex subunit alpha, muscle-specific form-like isoform X2 n=1 Tax=Bolinopsis microptera TaxID=2820187 RepID=UPI003079ABE2